MKRLLLLTALLSLAVPASAQAAKGVYAKWTLSPSSPTARVHTGTIRFGVSGIPNATFKVVKSKSDSENVELFSGDTGGDWLTGTTSFGRVFGKSGPSKSIKYLKVAEDALSGANRTVATITFRSPMPAGNLGLVFGDLDVDKVTIQARSGSGARLSGRQLRGLAAKVPFNFCNVSGVKPTNCGSDTNVPTWKQTSTGGVLSGDDNSSDGSAGILRPNQSIKSITVTFQALSSSMGGHSYRLWMAVPSRPRFTG